MREIKFRVWDIDSETMTYMNNWEQIQKFKPCMYEENPVMQYTGLKDENGVEIYEGDVVATHGTYPGEGWFDTGEHDYEFEEEVAWDGIHLTFRCNGYDLCDLENLEVTGNIYETQLFEEDDDNE